MKILNQITTNQILFWICIWSSAIGINSGCISANKPETETLEKRDSLYIENDTLTKNGKIINMFMPSKNVESQGEVINGKREGIWKFFREDGKLIETVTYKEGYKHGENLTYSDIGKSIEVRRYDKALLHGEQLTYWEDGKTLKIRDNYLRGVRSGVFLEYFENGKLSKRITYEHSKKNGKFDEYDFIEKLNKHYKTVEGVYKMDKKNGVWRYWDFHYDITQKKLGSKLILTEYQTYEDDKLNGKSIEFDSETGRKLIETFYLDGLESGIRKSYCPSGPNRGRLWLVEHYESGEKIGDEPYKCECNG